MSKMTETLAEKKITTPAGYKHKCTNCMACYNICPSDAIEMIEDIDGFVYPSIVEDKCTHCGLCSKKCPALNIEQTKEISQRLENPLAYGGHINNEEIREKSSSGGVFSILSKYVLDKGGYVCGARFTKGGICEHVIVDNWNDLAPLRGSKYVQSNINNCLKKIKSLLEQDKYVLFTGTPCQVAGLYAALGKDYEKLITVDLLCKGVPPQKLFIEYLKEITNGQENEITAINFREKQSGWRTPSFVVQGQGFLINKPDSYENDNYIAAFVKNLTIRKSCTDCKFNRLPRMGDFSIGDFWGIEHYDRELDNKSGCSIILVNTQKSQIILSESSDYFAKLKEVYVPEIHNYNMISRKPYNHIYRSYFFEKYANGDYASLTGLIKEALNKKDGIGIINYAYSKCNYGSVLTGYALQKVFKKRGYTPANIIFYDNESCPDLNNLLDFNRKHIDFTYPCTTKAQLRDLNNVFQSFIVGSDTMFLDFEVGQEYFNNVKFQFVDFSKNICSFAVSFGKQKLEKWRSKQPYSAEEMADAKRLLKRFSHISVRETSGVKICKENFGLEAECILDPVFFLTQDEWKKLFLKGSSAQKHDTKYILYLQKVEDEVKKYIDSIENIDVLYDGDDYEITLANINTTNYKGPRIEDWLQSIAECETLYTDSFHGMCFAILFNKQFILFDTCGDLFVRCTSLMNKLGIESRLAKSVDDIKRLLNNPIDYNRVNQKLQENLKTSEAFLEKILYSHEHPDPVRGYMESLEILVEQKKDKKPDPPPARKSGNFSGFKYLKRNTKKTNCGSIFWAYLSSKKSKKDPILITNYLASSGY